MKGNSDEVVGNYIKQALYLDPKSMTAAYVQAFMKLKEAHPTPLPSK
jgi:hypothetical protein